MKPFTKKELSPCSVSDDSPPQRPKRSTCQKNLGITNGLLWREETDLKRALYASLQETRRKNLEDDDDEPEEEEKIVPNVQATENGDESPKKAKVHAQRKFAQGSTPNSPVPTPLKVPYVNSSTTELLPYRRPKTEDFLTFLCLRGTSILPPSLDFLNSCSKSDSSSDCRSLSPEPEIKECSNVKEVSAKNSDSREKINAKHEIVENGVRKHACKASSKRHPGASQVIKKTNSTVLKSQKEVSIVRKRKSRDQNDQDFIPTNNSSRLKSSCNGRTRSSTFHALREKYKKQRIAADKKKLLPVKNTNASSSLISRTRGHATRSQSIKSLSKRNSPEVVETKTRLKPGHVILTKNKQTRIERKLALEKRKSLRSAHPIRDFSNKRISVLGKKTPWLRRAKLVPPIVDVDSDSEPEIISAAPTKKIIPAVTPSEPENISNKNLLSERLRSRGIASKVHSPLSSRQVLLRKHMQNRLKAKKNILKNKNIKSRTIIKRAAKQNIYKKVRKSLVMKTMSLRKDLQNKRVTRSAKHQIEELFWSNPEKRSKALSTKRISVSKSGKKRVLPKNFPPPKKQKVVHTVKDLKPSKSQSKEHLKKKPIVDGTRASKQNTSMSDVPKIKESVKITRSSKVLAAFDEKPSTSVSNAFLLPKSKPESTSNIKSTGANAANALLHTKSKTESTSNIKSTGANAANALLHTKSKTESMSNIKSTGANAANTLLHTKSKTESMLNIKSTGANAANTLLHTKSKTESMSNIKSTGANVANTLLHTKSKTESMSNIKSTGANVANTLLHTKSKVESMSNIKSTGANAANTLLHTKSKTESVSNIKSTGANVANTLLHTKSKTESVSNIKNPEANVVNTLLHTKSKTENMSNIKSTGANAANALLHTKSKTESMSNIKSTGANVANMLLHTKSKTESMSNIKSTETNVANTLLHSKSKIESISHTKTSEITSNALPHIKTVAGNVFNVKNLATASSEVISHSKTKSENISNDKNWETKTSNVPSSSKAKIENACIKNIPLAMSDTSLHSKTKTASISNDENARTPQSSGSSHPKSKSEDISNVKSLLTVSNTFAHPKAKLENGVNIKTSPNIKNSCAKLSKENGVSAAKESKTVNIPISEQSSSFGIKHITDIHKPSTSTAVSQSSPKTFDSEINKTNLLPSVISEIKTLNRVNNTIENNKNDFANKDTGTLKEVKEANVQNNLNFSEIEKSSNKDISKLIVLNVECDESNLIDKCEPCCSKFIKEGLKEKAADDRTSKIETLKEQNVKDNVQSCKKSLEKKYLKKHDKDHALSPRKYLEKGQKLHRKESEKYGKSHKKDYNKEKDSSGVNKDVRKSIDKLHRKKELNKNKHGTSSSSEESDRDIGTKSLSRSFNKKECKEKIDSILDDSKCNKKGLDKVPKKELSKDKSETTKCQNENDFVKMNKNTNKLNQKKDKIERNKNYYENNIVTGKNSIILDQENEKRENLKEQLNNKVTSKIPNEIILSDSDDDSDYITLDHFIKLKSESKLQQKSVSLHNNENFTLRKELNSEVNAVSNTIKDIKVEKKETDKELHKFKKDSDSSRHKKDNSKSKIHDRESKDNKIKSFRKEDKLNKREAEKSLARWLKRERFLCSKKEREKSKLRRDGSSSSKSSKRDFEKDGLKLSKKEIKDGCSSEKTIDINPEFLDVKKDKSSKKESGKLSRSNSYDETKSPKKKRRHNEFRDIEKIKKIFSKSSILCEISGFKEFKRRISGDRSEYKKHLSKSKKRRKLALLKEKKLSKKLSSKLLRKYSKKKGIKSKKSKLRKKELRKELMFTGLGGKLHSKSKKQKHRAKTEHHKKDSQEKLRIGENALISNGKVTSSICENSQFIAKLKPESDITEQVLIATEPLSNSIQMCTNETSTAPSFIIENVAEVVPAIEAISADVSQPIPADLVFSAPDELQTIVTGEFSGVFDEAFPSGTILLATRDSISQVPVHFIQDLSVPKTMADAATNTGDDDIDESINIIPEYLRSEEMSVGTQTITPAGSPSPTVEMRTLVPSQIVESPLADKTKDELVDVKPSTSTSSYTKVPEKLPLPTVSTPAKSKSISAVNSSFESSSPKVKKRTFVKKAKIPQHFSLSNREPFPLETARMVAAPVYYPTMEEFRDPLEYICKIHPEAGKYGICKIVPPSSFKPECKVNDDMRFTAHNQYVHKMLYRWGPNVQHTACIRKHLKSQKVKLEQAPLIGGVELDISKFYHTVQQFGGLQQVIEKKKWQRVADIIKVPKTAQDRVTKLYDAYCKYLVSYDTLPADEKQKLEEDVLADHERHVRLRNSAKDSEKEEEDVDDDENNDCVTKGRSMSLSNFFRIARNTMSMWFKNDPSPEEVEHEFWKVVTERQHHVVVHAGNIDSSVYQSGFPCNRNSPFAKHPWNLKVLTNNNSSILKCMGPVSGITIPTLHVGMLFTTGCWYRDPHSLPWIEYLHTGASKIWYGVPANGCEKFRNGMKKIMPEYCTNNPIWLPSDTAMVPPDLLVKHGASLSRTIQNSGQFVVIFPESFTSTICCGYCVSESVYFAPTPWLDLATKAFQDIRKSCEPPAFSLERLLFSIANDPKTQPETLEKILPMVKKIRSKELSLRSHLSDLGLKQCERIPLLEVKDKKKKSRGIEDESEQECEICRSHCYVSMVVYPQEDCIYCLPHALEHIPKKNLKSSKLMYTYNEKDLDELIKKIEELISSQVHKLNSKKKSPKKKVLIPSEKSTSHNKKENSSL